ncbi:tetratricopeptide repeat protein [Prochlorococcus sp. AH-716-I09]|nr:tetratricopeptide repeat protein [Prochlorococcus sp. AH-716-I09]
MSGFGETNKSKKRNISHLRQKYDENEILKKAINFHYEGKIFQASQLYKLLIDKGCQNSTIFSNYGVILINSGKLKDAEFFIRKAIKLNPKDSNAHYNLGGILKNQRKIKDAEFFIRKAIELNPKDSTAHYNLAIVLKDLGKLEESELSYRKAINIKPDYAEAHYNLGNILSSLGKLEESESSYCKVIDINPNYIKAYYALSLFKNSDEHKIWKKQLFSNSILNQKSKEDQIDIHFARANILHKEKNYEDSSKFIKLGNQLNLIIHPSNSDVLINKSKTLYIETIKQEINQKRYTKAQESIFIVGMPRSGSTLLESILSVNSDVYDLGESEILEESFKDSKKSNQGLNLAERYWEKINIHSKQTNKTTNKNLYNYSFTGIISTQIPNAKIIHCFRNPLDNILSIYRTNFAHGNEYSSSLIDCSRVYLNQDEVMTEYKKRFRDKIYDLNYDLLVCNPTREIKSLTSWLGWKWDDKYLSPHLNPRSVFTASKVQVRSPINAKSIGGWKNYKEMLKPAIEILTQTEKYQDIIS